MKSISQLIRIWKAGGLTPHVQKNPSFSRFFLSLIHLSVTQMGQMRNHEGHEEHEAVRTLSYFLMRILRSPCCPHHLCSVWITLYSFQRKRQKSMPRDVFTWFFYWQKREWQLHIAQGVRSDLIGNPVWIGSGPAAVTGDKLRKMPLHRKIGGGRRGGRMIRESEYLPWECVIFLRWIQKRC